jgi:dTDP-4-amino-4,6-dideoxygalactose transaminase
MKTPNGAPGEALAIFGGLPAVQDPPPVFPIVDEGDRAALLAVLESRVWGGYHPVVAELERQFALFHGATHGIATTNGTVSLEIALAAAGVASGDEVIVPPITFIASATAILRVGAVPVFADVDADTLNLSPAAVERAITSRTRAIIAVHFAGHPVDLDAFVDLCEQRRLILIEDCAHAPGASWRGRPVGSFGAFGSFSFQASKNLTSGEGGILITSTPKLAERASSLANQGRRAGGAWYEHVNLGTNARMTGFQAALILRQIDRLPAQVAMRARRAERLRRGLGAVNGIDAVPAVLDDRVSAHAYHLFPMRVDRSCWLGVSRERLATALQAEGVPVSLGYPYPIYRNALFDGRPHVVRDCPIAEDYCASALWLPHNALLADDSWIDNVIEGILKVRRDAAALLGASRANDVG